MKLLSYPGHWLPVALAGSLLLQGCIAAPVILGGAAVVSSTNDRRTLGTQLEDENIEIKAQRKFSDEPSLKDNSNLHVISYNTVVLIFGQAPSDSHRAKAEQLVSSIPKVKKIYNEVTVQAPTSLGRRSEDALMITNIKTQMITYPDLQASHVKLTVENGTVFLMGLVTEKQGQKAIEVARNARAVFKVVDLFEYIDEP